MTKQEIDELLNEQYSIRKTAEVNVAQSDYKLLKNFEAQCIGEAFPYDPQALHDEKQSYRDAINAAEEEIARLEALEPDTDGSLIGE